VLASPVFLVIYLLVIVSFLMNVIIIADPILYACFWSFVLVGYITYDISHYALHHIDTTTHKGSWFHKLQKYHNRHHFSGEDAGYGVSTPLWDFILKTNFKGKSK
jgi:dihydroceramide fatty acyl 2-hydroxylase